jgi:valyl-tRNA synthetase
MTPLTYHQDSAHAFENAERDFDATFNAIRAGRSLAASYSLQNDIQRQYLPHSHAQTSVNALDLVFFRVQSEKEAALFESQVPTMVTLTKGCKNIAVVRELSEIPEGCGSAVLTPTVAAYVLVKVRSPLASRSPIADRSFFFQGQIDLDVEIGKCEKKLDLAKMNLSKIQKIEAHADYLQTVPADVRAVNEDKVRF